jgi:hypothetical protein
MECYICHNDGGVRQICKCKAISHPECLERVRGNNCPICKSSLVPMIKKFCIVLFSISLIILSILTLLLVVSNGDILCDVKTIIITQPAVCLINNIEWRYESKVIINNTVYEEYKSYKITGDVELNDIIVFKNYDFTKLVDPIITIHYYNNFTFDCFVLNDKVVLEKIEKQICQSNKSKKGVYISSMVGLAILVLISPVCACV